MKPRILAIALSLVLAFVFSGCSKEEESIKIGAIFSVTGPASFLGAPEKNTLEMLAEQANAQGGILGRKIELFVYDDETNVNKAVLAAQKLIKKDNIVACVGPSTSGNTLAVMKFFDEAHIPLVSCAASEKIIKPVNPWVFKTPQSDRHAVTRILKDAKERGYDNIAILTVSDGYGQSGRAVLQELIPALGLTLVADEVYGPKDTDMTAQLTKIKGTGPDAIVCWGTNPGPAVVARNRAQLGMDTPLYMSHGVASKKFIELAGDSSNGILLPAGRLIVADQLPADNPQKKLLQDYAGQYEAKFNTPVSSFGGYSWDAFMLILEAIKMGNSADPASIRDNLEKLKNFPATTGMFSYSAEDHNGLNDTAFVMVLIENGDWKLLK